LRRGLVAGALDFTRDRGADPSALRARAAHGPAGRLRLRVSEGMSISATDEWRTAHPGAMIGLMELSGVENRRPSLALDDRKRQTEARVRGRYQGFTLPRWRPWSSPPGTMWRSCRGPWSSTCRVRVTS